ncbi:MAG TPA: right-handed parallel beta-helix repeat-containing protein, partial [Mycobacterium sp.]|nr:right-handed parallel beta-helix repeat-containing protein [Mycobacterium sp.]
ATLAATNDVTSSVQIRADGVSVSDLNLTAPLGGKRYGTYDQHKLFVAANNVTLSGITITGSAAAGVFLLGANNFRLDNITVRDSRADGIHMSDGSSNGVVNNAVTERTGDDGVAVVSYSERFHPSVTRMCRNIVINNPVVNGTTFGRGVAVVGGENVTYRNINVSRTSGAGVYVSTEGAPFFTQSTTGVQILGGSVTGAGWTPGLAMGALAVYGEHGGYSTTNVTFADLVIANTNREAQRNIRISTKDGGAVNNVAFRNISISQQGDLETIYSNVPPGSYTLSDVTLNGAPVTT